MAALDSRGGQRRLDFLSAEMPNLQSEKVTIGLFSLAMINIVGQHFWARGYFVSTVGRDEEVVRRYIRRQEQEDQQLDQLKLWS